MSSSTPLANPLSLTPPEGVIPPRLLEVSYRSRHFPFRKDRVAVRTPYGGLHSMYGMVEALTRAMQTRQIFWFRVEAPARITPLFRKSTMRWPDAFVLSGQRTGVVWE